MPAPARRRLRAGLEARRRARWLSPPDLGDLRRLTPIDNNWGFERGRPIDRVYVEDFLARHSRDIRGHVLEIAGSEYTRRYGSDVERVDVLHSAEGNLEATLVADLANAPHIPSDAFDCVILTQTLQFIYDARSAVATVERILASEGVLLATMPGITKISPPEDRVWGEWWHFTSKSARRLAEEAFGSGSIDVASYGNVLTAAGFLYGLSEADLRPEELRAHDPLYEVIVALRAVKRGRSA